MRKFQFPMIEEGIKALYTKIEEAIRTDQPNLKKGDPKHCGVSSIMKLFTGYKYPGPWYSVALKDTKGLTRDALGRACTAIDLTPFTSDELILLSDAFESKNTVAESVDALLLQLRSILNI